MPLFFAVLSGVLAGLSFPRYGFSLIAWIAYVPLLFSIQQIKGGKQVIKSYLYGFVSGFITNVILLYWVVVAMNKYGNINLAVSILGLVLLAAILSALYSGPFTMLIKIFRNGRMSGEILFIPVVWVVLEYVRTFLFSGFPWELLGYSQYNNLSLIQISRFTSVYGVSFLIMLFNTLLYEVIVWWYDTKSTRTVKYPYLFAKTVVIFLLITGILIYGDLTREQVRSAMEHTGDTITVGLIQGDIDQDHKWDPVYQNNTIASYLSLSQQAYNQSHPRLLIWPETATPFFFQSDSQYASQISSFVKSNNLYLLFGSPAYDYTHSGMHYYNSAFLMGPDGTILGRYDKRHLVPFGEYLPLRHLFFFLKKLTDTIGAFTPGRQGNLLKFGNVRIGTLICYEIIFPQLSADDVRDGANLLVTITDDAWFGNTSAPYQHLSMAVFRAVENERFVVRAANTGISAVIAPTGKILASTQLFVPAFIDDTVALINANTFYSDHGDVFAFACILLFLWFAIRYGYDRFAGRSLR